MPDILLQPAHDRCGNTVLDTRKNGTRRYDFGEKAPTVLPVSLDHFPNQSTTANDHAKCQIIRADSQNG